MKTDYIYERRQSAGRMEAVMLVVSVVGIIAALLALFIYGWMPSLALFLLSVIAFALSRVFDLFDYLLATVTRFENSKEPKKAETTA